MPEYRRRLPHRYESGTPIFITWRLKFTLPQCLLTTLQERKQEFETKINELSDEYQKMQRYQFEKKQFDWFDEYIAKSPETPTLLRNPELAEIVSMAIRSQDRHYYNLHAFCIMPNHVHVLLTLLDVEKFSDLSDVMRKIKGVSAYEINKYLGKEGSVWAKESYDHLVRNDKEFNRVVDYILDNPVKAGLVDKQEDWPHSWREVT